MATIFLIGDPEKVNTFCDAEMVCGYYGHSVLNPLNVPEIWDLQEAMIDASDAVLLLKGWQKSETASRQYSYASEEKNKKVVFYSAKSEKNTRAALQGI